MGCVRLLPFLAIAVSCVISGWLSDRFIRSVKSFAGTGLARHRDYFRLHDRRPHPAMALPVLACLAFGIYISNLFAITQPSPAAGVPAP